MSDCVACTRGRAFPRLALAGLGVLLLAGCSSDVTRFSQSDSPFSNPFASNAPAPGAASSSGVTTSPLARAAPAPSSTRSASLSRPQAVGGSAVGWTAVGGSPIVVANGETLDSLSGRYGVPAAALLSANGLSSPSEVRGGMRLVVPVYHADDHAVASAEKDRRKHDRDVAEAEPEKALKAREEGKRRKGKDRQGREIRQGGGEVRFKERRGRGGQAVQAFGDEEGRDRQDADRQPRIGRGANKGAAHRRAG